MSSNKLNETAGKTNRESNGYNARWEFLEHYFTFAVGGVLAISATSFVVAAGRFEEAFGAGTSKLAPYPQMSFILLIFSFIFIAHWYLAVRSELKMAKLYIFEFLPHLPDIKLQVFIMILLLGMLAYFSNKPVVYSSIYASINLTEIWLLWLRDQKLRDVLNTVESNMSPEDERKPKVKVIEHYYLRRPQIPLATAILCIAFIALIFSIIGGYVDNGRLAFSIAYSLLLSGIIINLGVYTYWRKVRDKALGEIFF